jgi:adenosylmethionine-8-amino-7-oxononanoate aminotransferase
MRQAGAASAEPFDLLSHGEGVWVWTEEKTRYLDAMAGLWLVNVGHGRAAIADAVSEQIRKIAFTPPGTAAPVTLALAAEVVRRSPHPDGRVFLVNSGSEAVEAALKMARQYFRIRGEPKRHKFIARSGSYHGNTLMGLSLSRPGMATPEQFEPLPSGTAQTLQPNHFRCTRCEGGKGERCLEETARDLERVIFQEGPESVAGFIAEPISVAAGIHDPGAAYWRTIREICSRHGILFIADEVVTGFGRTGKMFGSDHWGLNPDLMTVAKGLSSGYAPIGAVIVSKTVADAFMGPDSSTFRHIATFGGNPVSAAAALANLAILEKERLVENADAMGRYLYERAQALSRHPLVGDVRGGKGLLCAIELVADRATLARFPPSANVKLHVNAALRKHGVLTRAGDVIPLCPPLCITREECDFLVNAVDLALTDLGQTLGVR